MTERSVVDPGVNAGGCCHPLNKPQNDYGLTVLEVGTEKPLHEFNCGNI